MSSQFVLIDDTNPSIQYSGPWFEVNTSNTSLFQNAGFGLPFQGTSHGVNVTANFSFSFSGSSVLVYGSSPWSPNYLAQDSTTIDTAWECFIDNTSIGSVGPVTTTSENNLILCGGPLQDGPHLLTVIATVSNQQTFWFDQIQYAPSASVPQKQPLLRIDSSDSAIQYSSGWQSASLIQIPGTYEPNISYTQTGRASLKYQFFGTSISWVGTVPLIQSGNNASAYYFLDQGSPVPFIVPTTDLVGLYNQTIFKTGKMAPGQHTLEVVYGGDNTTALLALNYLFQQDASASSRSLNNTPTSTSVPSGSSSAASAISSSTSNIGPSSSSTTISSTIDRKPTGAIIGGVIGGLVLISLLLALFFFNHRRNNRRSQALSEMSYAVPSPDVVIPFTVPSSNPTSYFLSRKYTSNPQSLPSQTISSKFTHQRGQPPDPTSSSGNGGITPFAPLRPQFSSPTFISPSSPLTGSQTNPDGTRTRVPQSSTEPLMQRSPSPREANTRFLWHEDSGVRIPPAEDDIVELPPFYTPE